MHKIQLNDKLYKEAERRAREGGFGSVDEFVAERLESDFSDEQEDLDHLFTPEVIAEIDKAEAEMNAGNFFTSEQVDEHFKKKRAAWKKKNGRR
jgi:Arc/MetJ-type ribon-helix-helix transcriptional regulator